MSLFRGRLSKRKRLGYTSSTLRLSLDYRNRICSVEMAIKPISRKHSYNIAQIHCILDDNLQEM